MDWWLWILLGLALLAIEILTPGGFYVLFFGAGALVVGVLAALGAADSLAVQGLWFSVLSVASLALFRGRLVDLFRPTGGHEVDSLRQEVAVLLQDLPANGFGKAELRGTTWSVRNTEGRDLPAGQRCRVDRAEGLTLWVKAE